MKTDHIACSGCGEIGHIEVLPHVRALNPVCLLLGVVILPLLWCAGRKTELRCMHCNSRLSIRGAKAWVALGAFWILTLLLLLVLMSFLLGG